MHFILIYHDSIEKMKIEKIEKLAANLDDKAHILFNEVLNHGLISFEKSS